MTAKATSVAEYRLHGLALIYSVGYFSSLDNHNYNHDVISHLATLITDKYKSTLRDILITNQLA